MAELSYLQSRAVYYILFVADMLNKPARDVYLKIAPIFVMEHDAEVFRLVSSETLNRLQSCEMLEMYQNYVDSFCCDPSAFGRKEKEREGIQIKSTVLNVTERLRQHPTGNALAALCDKYDNNSLSVAYALTLYCNNRPKSECIPVLKRAIRNADGLDACLALLYMDYGHHKEWIEVLKKNPLCFNVMNVVEQHYQVKEAE